MWWQLLWALVLAVIGALLAPKPPKPENATQENPEGVPSIEDTAPVAVLFGTKEIKQSNVVWYGDLKTEPITQEAGGK